MSKGFLPLTRYAINIITDMPFNNNFCRVNKTLKIEIFSVPIRFKVQMLLDFFQTNFHICLLL